MIEVDVEIETQNIIIVIVIVQDGQEADHGKKRDPEMIVATTITEETAETEIITTTGIATRNGTDAENENKIEIGIGKNNQHDKVLHH